MDEVCAYVLGVEQQKHMDEARKGQTQSAPPAKKDPFGGKSALEWMTSPQFES